jgi:uncharacterized protein DUF6734
VIRAIWSFWSKPYTAFHHNAWLSEKHHLLSWILSLGTAQKNYPDTLLITDDAGAELLVKQLGLQFQNVSLELNELRREDPHWWTLGKLHAYRSQRQPFLHVDNDVFLWGELPREIVTSQVFAQNPEIFHFGGGRYRPELWESAVKAVDGTLPCEWTWYTRRKGSQAVCCGILGGCNNEFIAYYADKAIHMVQYKNNNRALTEATERIGSNILLEQYFLAACINYHRLYPRSRFYGIDITYLFNSEGESFMSAAKRGYTHLLGSAKRNVEVLGRLERRVRQEYPEQYRRLVLYLRKTAMGFG